MTRAPTPGTIGFACLSGALNDYDPSGEVRSVLHINPEVGQKSVPEFVSWVRTVYIPGFTANLEVRRAQVEADLRRFAKMGNPWDAMKRLDAVCAALVA